MRIIGGVNENFRRRLEDMENVSLRKPLNLYNIEKRGIKNV